MGEGTGQLVRVKWAPDQPLWTRRLVGRMGVVVLNDRVGFNRHIDVLVEGKIHRLHPLDLEWLEGGSVDGGR